MAYVKRRDIQADAINGTKIADDSVDSEHIAAGALDTEHYAANSVTVAKLDDEVLQIASGTIANAAVRTLNATPVELIAAPGAGKMILVHRAVWQLDYATAGFDAAAAGDTLVARYNDSNGAICVATTPGDTFGGATADTISVVGGVATAVVGAATGRVNQAVVAHINTGEWYAAAGGSAIKWKLFYSVVDIDL